MIRFLRWMTGVAVLAGAAFATLYLLEVADPASNEDGDLIFPIQFADAGGLEAGAYVRHRGVVVGEVRRVELSPNMFGVVVEVAIRSQYRTAVRERSRFWVVRPRFEGLGRGVQGLDTLIRSPYLVFDNPQEGGPPLEEGEIVFGLEGPPGTDAVPDAGPPPQPGDLEFVVRFARAHSLKSGAPVNYRDVAVGEVRLVDLTSDGRGVDVHLVIRQRYRDSVRANSRFWIVRPALESGLFASNIMARDLGALLTGPSLAFDTPSDSTKPPMPGGAVVAGWPARPEDAEENGGPLVSIPAVQSGRVTESSLGSPLSLVEVSYVFVEEDTFSDDRHHFQGTGLVVGESEGEIVILTARSLVDGAFSVDDGVGEPEIVREVLRVRFSDGTVSDARPIWKDPRGADLALVSVPDAPEGWVAPHFLTESEPNWDDLRLVRFSLGEVGSPKYQPIPAGTLTSGQTVRTFPESYPLPLSGWLGAIAVDSQDRIVAVLGRRGRLSERSALSLTSRLPEEWRAPR
ncbi:MAG: MlaD family protein [Planctomycetota bacterium]